MLLTLFLPRLLPGSVDMTVSATAMNADRWNAGAQPHGRQRSCPRLPRFNVATIAQERLGHATVAITLDLYSHVLPGMQADAASRVDEVLQQALEKRRGTAKRVAFR